MQKVILNAVVATTTSDGVNVENLTHLSFQLVASAISAGNGAFAIQGSNDGTNWTALAVIDNLANAITEGLTRITSKTVSANGAVFVFLDDFMKTKVIRVVLTRTTDGTFSCIMMADKIA